MWQAARGSVRNARTADPDHGATNTVLDVEVRDDRLSRAAADTRLAAALRDWLCELERDYGQAGVQVFSERAGPLVEELERRQAAPSLPDSPDLTTEPSAPWWRSWWLLVASLLVLLAAGILLVVSRSSPLWAR